MQHRPHIYELLIQAKEDLDTCIKCGRTGHRGHAKTFALIQAKCRKHTFQRLLYAAEHHSLKHRSGVIRSRKLRNRPKRLIDMKFALMI